MKTNFLLSIFVLCFTLNAIAEETCPLAEIEAVYYGKYEREKISFEQKGCFKFTQFWFDHANRPSVLADQMINSTNEKSVEAFPISAPEYDLPQIVLKETSKTSYEILKPERPEDKKSSLRIRREVAILIDSSHRGFYDITDSTFEFTSIYYTSGGLNGKRLVATYKRRINPGTFEYSTYKWF